MSEGHHDIAMAETTQPESKTISLRYIEKPREPLHEPLPLIAPDIVHQHPARAHADDGDQRHAPCQGGSAAAGCTLACFRDRLGVQSFNVAICMPPLAEVDEDWSGFPILVRLVDRGDPVNRTGDIGGMELYAANVVGTDPFFVIGQLKEVFGVRRN